MFSDMRRAGFKVGLSKNQLKEMMYDILLELPVGTKEIKNAIVFNLGMYGQLATTREIDAVWNEIKRKAARECPDKFELDKRGSLVWYDNSKIQVDKNISTANFKKLNELANAEKCNINQMLSKLFDCYKKGKKCK